MSEIVTYRSRYDAAPVGLPSLFRPVTTDLGNPKLFHAPFDARGMRWAIVADDAQRSWQVPLFQPNGDPLWHWGEIRKRNPSGWQDGIGAYLDAERAQMDQLGLTYQPDLWLTQGNNGSTLDGKWRVYRNNFLHTAFGQASAVSTWVAPGVPDPAPLSQVHNDTVTLVLKGSKVWARCNPWLRIAMPYGMPGEVQSDSAAWNALATLKGALEIVFGYLTDNVMLMAKGALDIIETWYDYATAGARERAQDQMINDGLKSISGSQGLERGTTDGPITLALAAAQRKKRHHVITWTARKKAIR